MKRPIRTIFSLLLAIIMLLGLGMTAFAADSTITFKGAEEGFAFQPGSEYTATDLFDNFKDVMPGDKLTETITIENGSSDSDYIKLYMRALVHDEDSENDVSDNPLTYSEAFENTDGKDQANVAGQRDETVATMQDFLAQLTMRIYNGEQLIYEASPDQAGALVNNVLLATLRQGDTASLKVELDVPTWLGNEYANRVGEVDWVFLAEGLDDPEPEPEPTQKPAESTPAVGPATGDTSNPVLLLVLLSLAGAATVVLLLLYLRRKKESDRV